MTWMTLSLQRGVLRKRCGVAGEEQQGAERRGVERLPMVPESEGQGEPTSHWSPKGQVNGSIADSSMLIW
jgi:hypothetical protein